MDVPGRARTLRVDGRVQSFVGDHVRLALVAHEDGVEHDEQRLEGAGKQRKLVVRHKVSLGHSCGLRALQAGCISCYGL